MVDDTLFIKESVSVISQIDGELLRKDDRNILNNLLIALHGNLDNQQIKRQLRSKNKSLCAIDPSLSKL